MKLEIALDFLNHKLVKKAFEKAEMNYDLIDRILLSDVANFVFQNKPYYKTAKNLSDCLGVHENTIVNHFSKLRDCGLIKDKKLSRDTLKEKCGSVVSLKSDYKNQYITYSNRKLYTKFKKLYLELNENKIIIDFDIEGLCFEEKVILGFIASYGEEGYCESVKSHLAEVLGLSRNTVYKYLNNLCNQQNGLLEKKKGYLNNKIRYVAKKNSNIETAF